MEMKKKRITSRQKEIILLLVQNPINKPITISTIAKKLELSSRTVLRDMENVEKWLYENDFEFVKKPGVGLVLNETLENQKLIKELLEEEKVEKEYSKEERKLFILSELLSSNEPIKAFYFTKNLKISEGTLNNDLISAGKWIEKFNLAILKKPGFGIYIEGNERSFRDAYINLIYDSCNEKEILEMIRNVRKNINHNKTIEISSENRLLNLIDRSIIRQVEKTLTQEIKQLGLNLADSAYIGLVVHISLAIQRIKNGENISMEKQFLKQLSQSEEFDLAKKIAQGIERDFCLEIPLDEVGYITMHIRGAKLRFSSDESGVNLDYIELLNISSKIIDLAEKEFNVSLSKDERLLNDLTNHLGPAISRLSMGMKIRNPLLEEIKKEYSYFYVGVEKICILIKDRLKMDILSESEVAYITMHIASAIDRNLMINTNINVVVSCPTGIGTSRFLVTKIQKNFNNINVIDTISAINIDEEYLNKKEVDLIISTVNLNTTLQHICVKPFMDEKDKNLIQQTIRSIAKNKMISMASEITETNIDINENKNEIFELMNIGKDILKFLKDIELIICKDINNIEELVSVCSRIFANTDEDSRNLFNGLKRRISISTPYVEEINMIFLHCSSENISDIKLGIIRLEKEICINTEEYTKYGILMFIPQKSLSYQRQLLSEISSNLIENEEFLNIIKNGTKEDINNSLEEIVAVFYTKIFLDISESIKK